MAGKEKVLYTFVQSKSFQKQLAQIDDPSVLEIIEVELGDNPQAGDLLKGGVRKARVRAPNRGGKSGGYRVFYYFIDSKGVIFLIWLLDKKDAENLTPEVLQQVQEIAKTFQKP